MVALLCGALATSASANFKWEVTITVPPDTLPDDAHLIFQNTGGIKGVESKDANILNISANGNQVDLTFVGKLDPGTQVTFNFWRNASGAPPVLFNSGTWTNNEVVLGPISPTSVVIGPKVPGMGTLGLVLLSLLTLGSGACILGRRRTATA